MELGGEVLTLVDFFQDFAGFAADFVVYDDGYRRWSYSYRQIARAARDFAAQLADKGIVKGDKILLWSENCPEWLVVFWGSVLKGVIVVPIDYRASAEVLRKIQQVVQARIILVGEEVKVAALDAEVWHLNEISISSQAYTNSSDRFRAEPADVVEIVFTSGSTASPKGVIITHRNIVRSNSRTSRKISSLCSSILSD
jgi:long-chain acyl-CoA synthetase